MIENFCSITHQLKNLSGLQALNLVSISKNLPRWIREKGFRRNWPKEAREAKAWIAENFPPYPERYAGSKVVAFERQDRCRYRLFFTYVSQKGDVYVGSCIATMNSLIRMGLAAPMKGACPFPNFKPWFYRSFMVIPAEKSFDLDRIFRQFEKVSAENSAAQKCGAPLGYIQQDENTQIRGYIERMEFAPFEYRYCLSRWRRVGYKNVRIRGGIAIREEDLEPTLARWRVAFDEAHTLHVHRKKRHIERIEAMFFDHVDSYMEEKQRRVELAKLQQDEESTTEGEAE